MQNTRTHGYAIEAGFELLLIHLHYYHSMKELGHKLIKM